MNGASSMPYLDGSNPYLANYLQVNDFANPRNAPGNCATTSTCAASACPA